MLLMKRSLKDKAKVDLGIAQMIMTWKNHYHLSPENKWMCTFSRALDLR